MRSYKIQGRTWEEGRGGLESSGEGGWLADDNIDIVDRCGGRVGNIMECQQRLIIITAKQWQPEIH